MTVLISAAQLRPRMQEENLLIIDCRADLAQPERAVEAYVQEHLPGAVHAHLEQDLSGPVIPGQTGRHPLPSQAQWQQVLRRWGVTADTRFALYDQSNGMYAARCWWLLRWAGFTDIVVLNGGLNAYKAEGGELTTLIPTPAPSDLQIQTDDNLLVNADAVQQRSAATRLLDARALPRYEGKTEPLDSKAGHIPGAENADFTLNLDADGYFLDSTRLQQRFQSLQAAEVICYCGSGVTACHNILAITEAGLPMPRLYPGSWSEWITDDRRPIATGCEGTPL